MKFQKPDKKHEEAETLFEENLNDLCALKRDDPQSKDLYDLVIHLNRLLKRELKGTNFTPLKLRLEEIQEKGQALRNMVLWFKGSESSPDTQTEKKKAEGKNSGAGQMHPGAGIPEQGKVRILGNPSATNLEPPPMNF